MTKPRRIDGIDLSHFQAGLNINWTEAKKAGVKFVYHKATEHTDWTDASYAKRRAECKKAGIPFGGYHFAHPVHGNATKEAQAFLDFAKPAPGDLVPALDLEVNDAHLSEADLTTWVAAWFDHVFKATGISKGVLYTPFNLRSVPKGVRLWVARYNNDNALPTVRAPFKTWTLWQFSDGRFGVPAAVPGVGHVDIDTLHKKFPWANVNNLRLPLPKPVKKPHVETDIERLLRIAGAQVGYHEGRTGTTWNNIQKFSPAVPGLEWSQGQPWCATFVSWVAMKAGLDSLYPRTASTVAGATWFKQRAGQWSEYPAVGAQVFFGQNGHMEHTGIVEDYDADYIYTIEGNTNTNGSAEGDGVYRKKRARRDPYVQGYGYPAVTGGLKSADPNYKRSN